MYSKRYIADQVLFKLYPNGVKPTSPVQLTDVYAATEQYINQKYRSEQFTNLQTGETIPSNLMLMTFESVPVTSILGNKATCTLPAIPVNLQRNMGVYDIEDYFPDGTGFHDYIPVQAGQFSMLEGNSLICECLSQVLYETKGNKVTFHRDIVVDNVKAVTFQLVVMDFSQIDEFQSLPLAADIVNEVVQNVWQSFLPVESQPRIVDSYADNSNKRK